MRQDNPVFAAHNESPNKSPRYVIEVAFDTANTDLHYFTSHSDAALPGGAVVTHGVVKSVSAISQKLDPIKAIATIGAITVALLDRGESVTTLIASKLAGGNGLRKKRLRFYRGYEGAPWSEYELFQTQIIDNISVDMGVYTVSCSDIQRSVRQDIFDTALTRLTATIDENATTIPVIDTSKFQAVAHGASYTDAPGAEVVYIWLDDEAIRCPVANITANAFGNVTRGALSTKRAEHKVDAGADDDRKPEVAELVYLEMPAPKLAYALLTGELYGQPGKTLPDGWHLNIDPIYVRASDFTGIGVDWWDPADDTVGINLRFVREEKQDGKQFIEEQINQLLGAFSPVYSDGALGLRRMSGVLSDAPHSVVLDSSNVVQTQPLTHDMRSVHNQVIVKWNYDPIGEKTTREYLLQDNGSISRHGLGERLTLEFRGLHGSRHTQAFLSQRFDALRSRYAGPPLRMSVRAFDRLNTVEVGDIDRVTMAHVRDFTGDTTTLDRAFEVQGTRIDSLTGQVTLDLFGSAEKAQAIAPTLAAQALADSYYTSAGIELQGYLDTNYPGAFTATGGVGHIQADCTLPGHADITNAAAIYYYNGPLQIDSGVTVTITQNVQVRAKGHIQNNGAWDGVGAGRPGVTASETPGVPGFVGSTRAGGGVDLVIAAWISTYTSQQADLARGLFDTFPDLTLTNGDGASVGGIPTDLRGTSGGSGIGSSGTPPAESANGGAGGASGAGLMFVCRGFSHGASGSIDLSGTDGSLGGQTAFFGLYAGSGGGGAPGACLVLLDGEGVAIPNNRLTALLGATPVQGTRISKPIYDDASIPGNSSYFVGLGGGDQRLANFHYQYVPENIAPQEDVPAATSNPLLIALAEYTNTPISAAGNLSSIEVTITPPTDGNYSYANVYYRVQGTTAWTRVAAGASNEAVQIVARDGVTYEFMARGVSIFGIENATGTTPEVIAVSSVGDLTTVAPPTALVAADFLTTSTDGLEVMGQLISWTLTADTSVVGYDVEYKLSTDSDYQPAGKTHSRIDTSIVIPLLKDDTTYNVRISALNSAGYISNWLSGSFTTGTLSTKLGGIATGATQNTIYRQTSEPAGTAGDLWYKTDTFVLHEHNGTSWNIIANDYTYTSQLADDADLGGTAEAGKIVAGTITGSTLRTAASGKRFIVDTVTDEARFYDASDNIMASIGLNSYGADDVIGKFGLSTIAAHGVWGLSSSKYGVIGETVSGAGVYGGVSGAGYAGQFVVGSGAKGHLRLSPFVTGSLPTHSAHAGAIHVKGQVSAPAHARVFINQDTSTTWNEILSEVGMSLATSGYINLSNGLIVQWGQVSSGGAGYVTVTLPITFPTACLSVVGCIRRSSGAAATNYSTAEIISTSQVKIGRDPAAFWIAIGY